MNVTTPNVAFIGRAGAGKTTAAEMLTKYFGYQRLSFAAPLKVMLGTTTDRSRMQEFGTDVVRAYEPDAWVNLFVDTLNRRRPLGDRGELLTPAPVTVDDARFLNEIQRLKIEDFMIVRVDAPRHVRLQRLRANGKLQDEAQLDHVSETELDGYIADYDIDNGSDPEWLLLDQVTRMLNKARR